jgi:hypothetical protein
MIKKIVALMFSILIFYNCVLAANPYRVIQVYNDIISPEFKTNRLSSLSNHAIKNLASIEENDFNNINMMEINKKIS